ncbi:unnamed protein product [Rotaria socialis]
MSSTDDFVTEMNLVIRYFNISAGSLVFIVGLFGNIMNTIIFLSLKTFRKNPCAFCLLVMSIADSSLLLSSVLPNILLNIIKDHSDANKRLTCKIQTASAQIFGLMSHTTMCFGAIDQFTSTSLNEPRRRFNLKSIQCLIIIAIVISILYGIPFFIYYDAIPLSGTNVTVCLPKNSGGLFSKYVVYVDLPIFGGFLPVTIMSILGLLTFRNVRHMARKHTPISRLHLDQQLTGMILMKDLNFCVTVVPFLVVYIVRHIVSLHTNDTIIRTQFQLVNRVFVMLFYVNYADNFYIFVASSGRFRRQLKYVLINIHFKLWRAKRNMNRIHPAAERFELSLTSYFELIKLMVYCSFNKIDIQQILSVK